MPLFTSLSVQSCRRRWRKHHLWNYFGCFVGCHAPCILGIFYGSPSILGCQKPLRKGEKAACPWGHDRCIDREYFEMTITCTVFVPPIIFVFDPPVVGSDKFVVYISLQNTLGFQTQDFQSCIFPEVGCWRCILSHRAFVWETFCSLCKSFLAQPAGGGWLGDLHFFPAGWLGCLLDTCITLIVCQHLLFCKLPEKYLCRLWSWLCFVLLWWLLAVLAVVVCSCCTIRWPSSCRCILRTLGKEASREACAYDGIYYSWKSHETSTVYWILYQP